MRVNKLENSSFEEKSSCYMQLFSKAVKDAKEINRKNGLPNDFVINGKRYYELPNGEITTENPLKTKII